MDENQERSGESKSTRRVVGRFLVIAGLIIFITGLLYSFGLSLWIYLSNLNGIVITTNSLTYQIPSTLSLIGVIILLIGVILLYATNQFSTDGIWSLKTGPYVR